jgi:hypothetical protein
LEKVPLFNEDVEGSGGSWEERHEGVCMKRPCRKAEAKLNFFKIRYWLKIGPKVRLGTPPSASTNATR